MKISDIHTHILYGIDDGAYNCEMSMELIRMEYEQGVRDIFLTNGKNILIFRCTRDARCFVIKTGCLSLSNV